MNKIKILLVDDDEELRNSISLFLRNKNYDVIGATNGVKGFDFFLKEHFDIIISDIKMPFMDGTTLLNAVKSKNPKMFFILITGFAEILATIDAFKIGADGFLAKPFKLNELEELINNFIQSQSKKDNDDTNTEFNNNTSDLNKEASLYEPIQIDKFIHGSIIDYPIFIKLGTSKYVKIAHKGEDISEESITKYKNSNVKFLYLLKSDYKEYVKMNKYLAHAITDKKIIRIPKERKLKFLSNASEVIINDIFCDDIHKNNFESANVIMQKTFQMASDNNDLFKICDSVISHSDKLYAHSLFVSVFSVMLARQLKWGSEKNMHLISMGALFHDLGKKNISPEILNKKLVELDFEEKKQIEMHPTNGAEMLMELPDAEEVVIQITLQHHENCEGTGYPSRISTNNIHPLSKVVSIANEFVMMLESISPEKKINQRYAEALKRLKTIKKNHFEKEYFNNFIKLFTFKEDTI